ncbi:RNA polymerase sigma-70 factor, ECF subfamily protein [Thalassotalea insulae]|uniref:RNA polymerase sigma-70 factor, ECF subfamily protein n=1 Tax=Thalassotalea insulae TaxID=2056778 RepID=A0ABQ6GSH0_9GAMM|nr:sigma-70 family RNA polymerase sigma factor [Thalassotalea insulae]GLX78868.1 RNA polymerase sigma-70 factor, ECF subfamily protein [Thalassotalea insulae]
MQSFETIIKNAYGTAFAVLNKRFQDIQQVEDALQYACMKAINNWQTENISNAKAWLIKVASNYIFDELKKHKPKYIEHPDFISPVETAYEYEDATLGLIFTCCHPSITKENQVALCLKWVMGFDNKSISRALLISEKTLEQRITRTKRKIIANNIDFILPTQSHLRTRLDAVNRVLYLVFNEGYFGNSGRILLSNTLCMQAIYLMRLICRKYRGTPSSLALLSLMLFIQARAPARATDKVTLLEFQDRTKWDKAMISIADILLQKSLKQAPPTSYHIQAAIAGLHSQASSYQNTDWHQICLLYEKLITYDYSPAITVNLAVALMQKNDLERAKMKLDTVAASLSNYPPYFITRAFLFERMGLVSEAKGQLKHAFLLSQSDAERNFIKDKLIQLAL